MPTKPVRKTVRIAAPRLGREERVDAILAAARTIFSRKGFEQTAVSEIAASIVVVEGTVFKYFATKRELLLKVLEDWYDDIIGESERDLLDIDSHRARLRVVINAHLRTVRDYPRLCRLMFREVRGEQDYHSSGLHAKNRRYTRLLTEVIATGVKAREFRTGSSPTLMRDVVYGAIEHLTWNYVCGRGQLDIEALTEQLTAIVCDGIHIAPSIDKTQTGKPAKAKK